MLSAQALLDPPPRRIVIAGVAGSGKTTLARRIAERTGIAHTEIDGLRHGANWTPRPEFDDDVERFTGADERCAGASVGSGCGTATSRVRSGRSSPSETTSSAGRGARVERGRTTSRVPLRHTPNSGSCG